MATEKLVASLSAKRGIDIAGLSKEPFRGIVKPSGPPPKAARGEAEPDILSPALYDCQLCGNRGYIVEITDSGKRARDCSCMPVRRSRMRLQRSGLENAAQRYTFDSYEATDGKRRILLSMAQEFADSPRGWLFMGGPPGTGKTHLCTAICNTLINSGMEVRYMTWRDDAPRAKRLINDKEYEQIVAPWKTCPVLYIDDLFKVKRQSGEMPTVGDINLAYEILNSRYTDTRKITLISSEFTISELLDIDEAIGSRIVERCGRDRLASLRGMENWRLMSIAN